MIIRDAGSEWLLITQPDHAALAGRLMRQWQIGTLPTRATREAALFATDMHDIGWAQEDAAPSIEPGTGRPCDFVHLAASRRQDVWRRAIAVLAHESTYTAALVAQHAITVYRRFLRDPEWTGFFAEMDRARDHWYGADARPDGSTGGPLDPQGADRLQFLTDYGTLALGDLASLIICHGWTDVHEQEAMQLQMIDDTLVITPDPFDGRVIDLEIPHRRIAARAYASDDDLRAAWTSTPIARLHARARGAAFPP